VIPVLDRARIRALDRHAIERCGVPGVVLMENAGRGAVDAIERWSCGGGRGAPRARVVIVAAGGTTR
jgi:NAD(P)H-hydrate epimerase